jgi:hypothetical protein
MLNSIEIYVKFGRFFSGPLAATDRVRKPLTVTLPPLFACINAAALVFTIDPPERFALLRFTAIRIDMPLNITQCDLTFQ